MIAGALSDVPAGVNEARLVCVAFAHRHRLVFDDNGTVGFGRECVGFKHGDSFVDFNPIDDETFEPAPEFYDPRLCAPPVVRNAYHKHDCLAVLVQRCTRDEAIIELGAWALHLSRLDIEVVQRPRHFDNVFALIMHGPTTATLRVKRND